MEIIAGTEASIVLVERYEFLRFRSFDKRGNEESRNDGEVESSGKEMVDVLQSYLFIPINDSYIFQHDRQYTCICE